MTAFPNLPTLPIQPNKYSYIYDLSNCDCNNNCMMITINNNINNT